MLVYCLKVAYLYFSAGWCVRCDRRCSHARSRKQMQQAHTTHHAPGIRVVALPVARVLRFGPRQPRRAHRPPHANGVSRELEPLDEPGRCLLVPLRATLDARHLFWGHEVRYDHLFRAGDAGERAESREGDRGEGAEKSCWMFGGGKVERLAFARSCSTKCVRCCCCSCCYRLDHCVPGSRYPGEVSQERKSLEKGCIRSATPYPFNTTPPPPHCHEVWCEQERLPKHPAPEIDSRKALPKSRGQQRNFRETDCAQSSDKVDARTDRAVPPSALAAW